MYDTGAKNNWNTLKVTKVDGILNRDRLEDLKKRIDQPIRREDINVNRAKDNIEDDNIRRSGDAHRNAYENQKGSKKFIKWMKDIVKDPIYMALQNEQKTLNIRPEFDDLRGKVRDGVSEKITQASKILQINNEDQILGVLAKINEKNKKNKLDLQRFDARKDLFQGQDDEKETKSAEVGDEDYIDFKRLNQEKVDHIAKENLNRVLPSDIENIQKLEEKKYMLMPTISGQNYIRPESYDIHPQLERKPFYQEDAIEYYSIVADKANKLSPIPFYREIGPFAREIINPKAEANAKNNKLALDLMNEKELYIDDKNITFDNIINIVTGRIPAKKLQKMLQHLDYVEESNDEYERGDGVNEFLPPKKRRHEWQRKNSIKGYELEENGHEMFRRGRFDEQRLRKGRGPRGDQHNNYDQYEIIDRPHYLEENYDYEDSYIDSQNPSNKNDSVVSDSKSVSKIMVEVEDYQQQFPTPRETIEEVRMDRETQTEQVPDSLTEDENSEHHMREEQNVNSLLREIENLKVAKSDSYKLPKSPALSELRQLLNNKIEDKLACLLYLIADDADRTKKLKDNLAILIKDIHLLEGKELDGHLKMNLLFQFLKEHRKLLEEKERDQQKDTMPLREKEKEREEKFETPIQQRQRVPEETVSYGTRVLSPSELDRYNSKPSNYSTMRKRTTDKLTQQNSLKSSKLPQPFEVRKQYMKQTQSSLRRLKDVEETHPKMKLFPAIEEDERGMWIGADDQEDISDDDDWVQVEQAR